MDQMQRVMIFVDYANFSNTARTFQRRPDLNKLKEYLANPNEGRDLVEMVVYLGLPPGRREEDMPESWKRNRDRMFALRDALEHSGIMTVSYQGKHDYSRKFKNGDPAYQSNIDILMAMDALEFSVDARPDIVVLVSGDGDFSYLAQKIRRRGIRVEAASMKENAAKQLMKSVNSFIDLTEFFNTLEGQPLGDASAFIDEPLNIKQT